MANNCFYEMRVRGNKENCMEAIEQLAQQTYEAYIIEEKGAPEDYMIYIGGDTRWSVGSSLAFPKYDDCVSIFEMCKKYNLEIEACGYEPGNEVNERYHYKGENIIEENGGYSPFIPKEEIDEEMEMVDDDEKAEIEEFLKNYNYDEDQDAYIVKQELYLNFISEKERLLENDEIDKCPGYNNCDPDECWYCDELSDKPSFEFKMSFDDLNK